MRYWWYMPYKDRYFNPRILGKCFYFVICMISRHWFQTKLPNYGDIGAKTSFCSLYNQPKTEKVYKVLFPRVPKHHLHQRCVSISVYLYFGSWNRGGGRCSTDIKWGRATLQHMKYRYSQQKITSMVNFL